MTTSAYTVPVSNFHHELGRYHVRRHVTAAWRHHEQTLFKVIVAAVPSQRDTWVTRLLTLIEGYEITHLEWLGAVPSSKATKGLEEQTEKIGFLKELGAARLVLPDLPLAGWSISRGG